MDPITIGLGLAALFATGKAAQSAKARYDFRKEDRECQELRDRADAIIDAMERRCR